MQLSAYNYMQNQIKIKKVDLHCPDRDELRNVLEKGLKERYRDVSVEWVPCPDLTLVPFHLAAPGLCGNTALVEIGDSLNTREFLFQTKSYDIKKDILVPLGYYHNSFLFGNGIAYNYLSGYLCELVINAAYLPNLAEVITLRNKSHIFFKDSYRCRVESLIDSSLKCHGQGRFFLCNGFFDFLNYVLKVHAKDKRMPYLFSNSEFIDAMQEILQEAFGPFPGYNVALGGVYTANNPSQSKIYSWKHSFELNNWEKGKTKKTTCTINRPDTILSTFHSSRRNLISVSSGPSIKLNNLPSTHSLFHHSSAQRCWVPGQIGIDIHDIEYFGYFCPAEKLYRIDEPLSNI